MDPEQFLRGLIARGDAKAIAALDEWRKQQDEAAMRFMTAIRSCLDDDGIAECISYVGYAPVDETEEPRKLLKQTKRDLKKALKRLKKIKCPTK